MKLTLLVLPLALVATTAAQRPSIAPLARGKQKKDGDIEYTSRSGANTIAARLGTHMPAGYWAGITTINSFEAHVQDQNDTTIETITLEIRAQDPAIAMPDWVINPGAPAASIPFTFPGGTAGAPYAFYVHFVPTAPITIPGSATGQGWYMSAFMPAPISWPSDGVSVHMGAGSPFACGVAGAPGCCGQATLPTLPGMERPKGMPISGTSPNIENLAPSDTSAGPLAFANLDRSYWHWFATPHVTLANLARDVAGTYFCPVSLNNEGHAAMHPDVADFAAAGRRDRLGWNVNGGVPMANGLALVFISRYCLETPIPVGFGTLYVDPTDVLFSAVIQGPIALNAAGTGMGTDNFLPGNELLIDTIGDLHCQALAINAGFTTFELSNLDTFGFSLGGSTPFTVDAANPVPLPVTTQNTLILKNNGHGNLRAAFMVGPVELGSLTVRERTTGKAGLPPGTTTVNITSPNTNPWTINPTKGEYILR